MSNKKITDDELQTELEKGNSIHGISRTYSMSRSAVRERIKRLEDKPSPSMAITGTSTLYGPNGEIKAQWVKNTAENKQNAIKQAIEAFKEELPQPLPTPLPTTEMHDLLAVYPLGDPHIGMLAWAEECGANWDLDIAMKVFVNLFTKVVEAAPPCKQALIVNLGDFFHYDNINGVTEAHGNILDRDGRYAKMVKVGVLLIRTMIKLALERHESVLIDNVTGNHDETGSLFLNICLSHIYENEPRVTINTSPSLFHYHRFGKVLIGTHHGHRTKMAKLPAVMAADMARDWGETEFRYWLTGHIHQDSILPEYPGCKVESFRTLAAPDAYAVSGGWRSGRDTKVIIMHKEFGEITRHTVPFAMFNP